MSLIKTQWRNCTWARGIDRQARLFQAKCQTFNQESIEDPK